MTLPLGVWILLTILVSLLTCLLGATAKFFWDKSDEYEAWTDRIGLIFISCFFFMLFSEALFNGFFNLLSLNLKTM